MSQYGAKAMAEQGYTYEDILHFYYTGITLDKRMLLVSSVQRQASLVSLTVFPAVSLTVISATFPVPLPYLVGKEDPYEALTNIPDYHYTVRYTYRQLGQRLKDKGYTPD